MNGNVCLTTIEYAFYMQSIQAGIVWINCSQPCFCQAPWGGNKRSGFGRELGEWCVQLDIYSFFLHYFHAVLRMLLIVPSFDQGAG